MGQYEYKMSSETPFSKERTPDTAVLLRVAFAARRSVRIPT